MTFHPKKPDKVEIKQINNLWAWANVVDVQYWKSGAKVREMFPHLWKTKKKILTHYNPYNLHEESWNDYEVVAVVNNFQKTELPDARLIPLCIDLDFFTFNRSNYTVDPVVNMAVSRIEGKKGVREVAQACNELGYKFILVGRISSTDYMEQIRRVGGSVLDFRNNVSDDLLKKAYFESAVHVCNSVDNFESGTMPVLEAMACGVPVMSRPVGHVPDIYNGKNLHLYEGSCEDVEAIKASLKKMMDDRRYRISLRIEAVETVKSRSDKWRASEYRKLYEEVAK